jgi:hypothetical protein
MKDGEKDGHQMHEEIHSIHPTENKKKMIVKNTRLYFTLKVQFEYCICILYTGYFLFALTLILYKIN